jgi:hypothetical protein
MRNFQISAVVNDAPCRARRRRRSPKAIIDNRAGLEMAALQELDGEVCPATAQTAKRGETKRKENETPSFVSAGLRD